ncbi:MAG: cadherin domain-containing protein [Desulfuromonadaceae bacterium]|nr:cadherin domain-containing protein [Desulfuromonadaceae bacterium]
MATFSNSSFSVSTSAGSAANELLLEVTNLSGSGLSLTFLEEGQIVSSFSLLDTGGNDVKLSGFTIPQSENYTFKLIYANGTDLETVLNISAGSNPLDIPLAYEFSEISFTNTDQNMWMYLEDGDSWEVGWHEYLPLLGSDFMQWQYSADVGEYTWVDTSSNGDQYWTADDISLLDISFSINGGELLTAVNHEIQGLIDDGQAILDGALSLLDGNIDSWASVADHIVLNYYPGGYNHQWEWAQSHLGITSTEDPIWKLSKIIYLAFTWPVLSFLDDGIPVIMPNPCDPGPDMWDGFSVVAAYAIQEKGYDLWDALKWSASQFGISSKEFVYTNAIPGVDASINLKDFFNAIVDVLDSGSSFITNIANTIESVIDPANTGIIDILDTLNSWFSYTTSVPGYPTYLDVLKFFEGLVDDIVGATEDIADATADLISTASAEAAVTVDADIFGRVGVQIDAELDGGSVDTNVQYTLSSLTEYNQSSDTLTITPTLINKTDGTAFNTASPNAYLSAKLLYDVGAIFDIYYEGELVLGGVRVDLDGNSSGGLNFTPAFSTGGTNLQVDLSGLSGVSIDEAYAALIGLDLDYLLDHGITIDFRDGIAPYEDIFSETSDGDLKDELLLFSLDSTGQLKLIDGVVDINLIDTISTQLSLAIKAATEGMVESIDINIPEIKTTGLYVSPEELLASYKNSQEYLAREATTLGAYDPDTMSIGQIINDYYFDETFDTVNLEQITSIFTNASVTIGEEVLKFLDTDWLSTLIDEQGLLKGEDPNETLRTIMLGAATEFAKDALNVLVNMLDAQYHTGEFVLVDLTNGESDALFHFDTFAFNTDNLILGPTDPSSWENPFTPYTDPDINENTAALGLYLAGGESDPLYKITIDVDQFIAILISKIIYAVTGVTIPSGLTNPVAPSISIDSLLTIVKADPAVAAEIKKYISFDFTVEKMDLDVTSSMDFSQEFTLTVDDMTYQISFDETAGESGYPLAQTFKASEVDSLDITDASTYDVNNDGKVDYTLKLVPTAFFSNDTELGYNIGLGLDFLRTVFLSKLKLPLLPAKTLADIVIGPVLSIDAEINGLDIDVYESRFPMDIGIASVSGSFDINVAPSFTAPATATADLAESVSSLMNPVFADVDDDNLAGIVITANPVTAAEGVWEYSTDGSNWFPVGAVSESAGLLLDKDTLLRFTPVQDYAGEKHSLTAHAVDDSARLIFTDGSTVHTYDTTADNTTSMVSEAGEELGYQIDLNPGNDTPGVNINSMNVAEGGTIKITAAVLNETDPDDSGSALTYTVTSSVTHGTLWLDTNKNGIFDVDTETALTNNSTFTQQNINDRILTYAHDGGETTSDSFNFSLADDGGESITNQQFAITVTPVDDPTVLTSVAGSDSVTIEEDTSYTYTIAASDPDSTLVYSVETNPAHGAVSLNATTGEYTYTPTANYHGSDSFSVGVAGDAATVTETVHLDVTGVADATTGTASISIVSDGVTANLDDAADGDGGIIETRFQWQISYDNGSSWSDLSAGEGNSTTYHALGGTYRCIFTTEDAEGGTTTFTTDSADTSFINNSSNVIELGSIPAPVPENTIAITIAEDTSYPIVVSAPAPYDHYEIVPQHGTISAPVVMASGDYEYTYTPDLDFYGTDQFRVDLMELMPFTTGDGQLVYAIAQTLYLEMTVANVEDEATGTITITGTAEEGSSLTASLAGISDVDGTITGTWQWQINNGSGWQNIMSATSSTLTIPSSQTYVSSSVRVVAMTTDTEGGTTEFISAEQQIVNVNDAPVISSHGAGTTGVVTSSENRTVVTTFSASDEDPDDTLTFSITGGADQALFSIDPDSGMLTFKDAPDYEIPGDSDGNNIYLVEVTATDALGATDSQALSITVTNANDAPVITSNNGEDIVFININENSRAVTTVSATDPDSATTLTYSISGGADQALFSINSSTGVVTFATAPNYENPTDSGSNNVYNVQVMVSDGLLSDPLDLVVSVTDVDESEPTPPQEPETDLFSGGDQTTSDDNIDTGLLPTQDYINTSIDGVAATVGTTTDGDTGETVQVFSLDPAAGEREDEDDTSTDVDLLVNDRLSLSLSDNLGLIVTDRTGTTLQDLRLILQERTDLGPLERQSFLDRVFSESNNTDVLEVTPTHRADDTGPTRLNITFDEGDIPQVIIINTSYWQGAEPPVINITGRGDVVVVGPGIFLGSNDGFSAFPDQDNDVVIGDDAGQTLFFGPGDDQIWGGDGDDIVASAGGVDQLYGDAGNDLVIGGDDADILFGGAGDDVLQGGQSDAGSWQFSLTQAQGLHIQFTPDQSDLPETIGAREAWFQPGSSMVNDARFAFTEAETTRLEAISSLYHAITGALPTLDNLNTMVSWDLDNAQFAEIAYNYYNQNVADQAQDISSQISALFDQLWGEGVATAEELQIGIDYILGGGSWSQALLVLSLHENHQQQIQNDEGELLLTQSSVFEETGWSADNSNDQLYGDEGNDILIGGYGSDLLDGGAGEDVAVQLFNLDQYQFRISDEGELQLVSQGANLDVDTLRNIETVRFGDQEVSAEISNLSQNDLLTAAALYQLITGQAPSLSDLNRYMSVGDNAQELAEQILTVETQAQSWDGLDNREFIEELAERVLSSPLSEENVAYLQSLLDSGEVIRTEGFVLALRAEGYQAGLFADGGMVLA